ncbi:MAG: hypothetical protein IJA60_07700 [Clostridia bacterium]|nr:hypothetical protein [Clostridia bacterium]
MRKLSFALCIIMLVSCFSFSAFAVTDTATMRWDEEAVANGGGYPRMAQRADGTLLLTTGGGIILHSTDKGHTWVKQPQRTVANASTSATITKDGVEYTFDTITRANFQPFVVSDGTVLLGYRFHTSTGSYTKGDPFYTSIRVMTSIDGGVTFDEEEILVEDVATGSNGFWEPFFVQIDEDTVLCYYADDLNVYSTAQQRIAYVTYDVTTKTWDKTPKIAIYRGGENGKNTRDGMPMVTRLVDGTYAMVVEVQDFASWMKVGTKTGFEALFNQVYTDSTFVVGLSLSDDGITWDDPIPVFGPLDLTAGVFCAAPSIATLPDGRVIITCQTDDTYTGSYGTGSNVRAMAVAISDSAITKDTVLTAIDPTNPKADGAAVGFTRINDVFTFAENEYCIWNAAFNCGNDVYVFGGSAVNAEDNTAVSGSGRTRIRHITAFANANEATSFDDAKSRAGENGFSAIYGTAENSTVTIGLPAGMSTANVYRMDGGKFLTKMDVTVADGKITFADEGGYYAVSDAELVTYGDATGDGDVTIKDALRIVKYIVNDSITADVAASDLDGSLTVNAADVLAVIKSILNF